jgi:hypothetical protein
MVEVRSVTFLLVFLLSMPSQSAIEEAKRRSYDEQYELYAGQRIYNDGMGFAPCSSSFRTLTGSFPDAVPAGYNDPSALRARNAAGYV